MSQITENTELYKSSAEILSELFSSFNADPPLAVEKIINKKHKKSKKKHKHKEKKHKKKSKKHNHSSNESSDYDSSSSDSKHKHKSKKKNKFDKWDIDFDLSKVKKEPEGIIQLLNVIKQETNDDSVADKPVQIKTETDNNSDNKTIENPAVLLEKVEELDNTNNEADKTNKIMIKNLKHSTVYEAAIKEIEQKALEKATKFEEGELTESEDSVDLDDPLEIDVQIKSSESGSTKSDRKRKHSHRDKSRDSDKEKKSKKENPESKRCKKHKEVDKEKSKHSSNKSSEHGSRSKDRDRSKEKTASHSSNTNNRRDREREYDHRHYDDYYANNSRSYFSNTTYDRERERDRDRYKYDRDKHDRDKRSRSRSKDRFRSKINRDRDRKRRSSSPSSSIDKKKLLEIARKNAINMLKSGTLPEALTLGPQAQEKVIAAIKAGGKTIEELTDFCKNLSKKEELGELSSVSSNEDEDDSENEKVFHHPFQLKEKPSSIVMNIKNATPLPVKTSKEKTAELRMQFPVSSGQLHRKNEGEWIPVSPKKAEAPLAIMPPPVAPPPKPVPAPMQPPAFVKASTIPATLSTVAAVAPVETDVPENTIAVLAEPQQTDVDISTIVSQRLNAMRRLQENPNDVQALTQMYKVQKEMSAWAQSKQQPGQFTGSTGAQILTPAELSSGYQAWARKDQLQNAAPVTGGMGMHLLQKMGWKPGEGLGKEKTGSLEPLLLEVKLDKKGLVANEEVKGKKPVKVQKNQATVKTLAGKHPVSLLGEYATKRKLGVPQYECCFECGPDHKKNFLFKVILNGIEYKPNIASSTKKQAKADAATVCLQQLGILVS